VARLSAEFGHPLPPGLVTYLGAVAPAQDVEFATAGNPLCRYGLTRLGVRQPGYQLKPYARYAPGWLASRLLPAGRLAQGADFLAAPEALGKQLELDVLHHFTHQTGSRASLMVFFGNGRQGVGAVHQVPSEKLKTTREPSGAMASA
jgi:hypothetical protein